MDVGEIEPVRLPVDLEEDAGLERLADHALDVDVPRAARADPPSCEMTNAIDIRVLHRLEHALGRAVLLRLMHGRDDPVELLQILFRDIDLAVGADVRLDAVEDRELRIPLADRLDLLELRVHAAVAQVVRMVGDRVVRIATYGRRLDHLLERVLAVGRPVRVRVQVAAHVADLDELRQLAAPCRLELARRLTELGRDRRVAEVLVERVLVLRAEHVAGLDRRDAVLGDRQPAPLRLLAHRDVVILGAGEMLQQVPVRLRLDDAQVEAEAVVRDDRRLRVAVCRDLEHPRQLDERRRQRRRIGRGRDHVEVAERLLAPPHRAGLGDVHRRGMLAQRGDRGLHRRQAVAEQAPVGLRILRLVRERLEDLLLALRAEPGEVPQLLVLRRGLQVGERRDPELLPDPRGRLRPEPRQAHELDDVGRHGVPPLRERVDLAGVDDLDDLLLDRLPDPGQLLRLSVERELRDRAGGLAHPRGRAPVREHPEGLRAFQLQQVGEQIELVRHVGVARQARHAPIIRPALTPALRPIP